MNKREAIQAMLDGKKVRLKDFSKNSYIYMDDFGAILTSEHLPSKIHLAPAYGWEIYEDPKKKYWDPYCCDWETSERNINSSWDDIFLNIYNPENKMLKITIEVEE